MTRPDLDRVLRAVNNVRYKRGLEPLTEMPKASCGRRLSLSCPLVHALEVYCVGTETYVVDREDFEVGGDLPRVLREFRAAFDEGLYPELQP